MNSCDLYPGDYIIDPVTGEDKVIDSVTDTLITMSDCTTLLPAQITATYSREEVDKIQGYT